MSGYCLLLGTGISIISTGVYTIFTSDKNNQEDNRYIITGNICEEINKVFKEKGIKTIFVLLPHEIQLDKILLEKYIKMWGINSNEIDVHYPTKRIVKELIERKLSFFVNL